MMKMILYNETREFQKDFKRLLKKFRSLESDLEVVKRNAIELLHLQKIDNKAIFEIPGFRTESVAIFKIKKFSCKALKNKGIQSGIRTIYAYQLENNTVTFIEMYFKGEKENEDRGRIKEYLNS